MHKNKWPDRCDPAVCFFYIARKCRENVCLRGADSEKIFAKYKAALYN